MPRILVLIALVAATAPASAAAATPRIVGGTTADDYPAQAEVSFTVGRDAYLCGGTLVAPQWVLTAGHCVSDERSGALVDASAYTVRLGSTTLDQGTPYAVDAVSRAPGFSIDTLAYDAALLHLSSAATETPLSLVSAAPAVGTLARVIGWGTTSENGDVSTTLQQVDVPIVSDSTCATAYGNSLVAATMECAGYAAGGMDACQGDSGGPLMVSENGGLALAGIVSTGDGCAEAGRYGVYTDMANTTLRTWFATTTGVAVATATATPTATPAATAVATTGPLVPRATLHLAKRCTAKACSFAVSFTTSGTVSARVTAHGRVIARASTAIASAGTHVLRLHFGRRLRHAVTAHLRVVATPTGGTATRATRAVRIHV